MRFFLLFFLLGIALAKPLHDSLDYEKNEVLSFLEHEPCFHELLALAEAEDEGSDDDGPKTELGKKLKQQLDDILEKIKDAIDHGKTVRDDALNKAKEIREKLKELKIDISEKAKELMDKIKDKAKDYLKKLWERLIGEKEKNELFRRDEGSDDEIKTELGKKLREHLDDILGKIKDAIDHGKTVKEDLLNKVKEIREKLKDLRMDMGEKAKELLKKLGDRVKEWFRDFLEKIGGNKEETELFRRSEEDDSDLAEKLRRRLDEVLEKIKEAFDGKKAIAKEIWEKLGEILKKLKEKKIDFGEKAKELLKKIKEKFKDYLEKILEKLGSGEKRSLAESIRERFQKLLDKLEASSTIAEIKQAIQDVFGKTSQISRQLIRLVGDDVEKAIDSLKSFIDRFLNRGKKRSIREMFEKLKDYFQNFKIELKEKFLKFGEYGKEKYDNMLDKTKTRIENVKQIANEFVKGAKDVSKDVAAEGLEFFRQYKDDLGETWDKLKDSVKEILQRKD